MGSPTETTRTRSKSGSLKSRAHSSVNLALVTTPSPTSFKTPSIPTKRKRQQGLANKTDMEPPVLPIGSGQEENDDESMGSSFESNNIDVANIPYRCFYGTCSLIFVTKQLVYDHMKADHGVKLDLSPIQVPADLKLFCPIAGCLYMCYSNSSLIHHLTRTHPEQAPLKLRLFPLSPPRDVPLNLTTKPARTANSSTKNLITPVAPKQVNHRSSPKVMKETSNGNRETKHPKKFQCDVPGCNKKYTKGSHVKRHKDTFHKDYFNSSNGSNGSILSILSTSSSSRSSSFLHLGHHDTPPASPPSIPLALTFQDESINPTRSRRTQRP